MSAAGVCIGAGTLAVGRATASTHPVFEQLLLPEVGPVFAAVACFVVTVVPMAVLAMRAARNRRTVGPTAFTAGVLTSAWALMHVLLFRGAWVGTLWFAGGVAFAVVGWREMSPFAGARGRPDQQRRPHRRTRLDPTASQRRAMTAVVEGDRQERP
ncbi:hypothetical protein [Rhodococcoides corynebacterioides]|uniref:hypothetical protein n=1 Tax=Rhodococcoides corynebacterioides TaxID=53972 RepID=UPI000831DA7A|nr:hypothetical protein [Rhodococcus corynebacterioides]